MGNKEQKELENLKTRSKPLEETRDFENKKQTARKRLETEEATRSKDTRKIESKEQTARKRLETFRTKDCS